MKSVCKPVGSDGRKIIFLNCSTGSLLIVKLLHYICVILCKKYSICKLKFRSNSELHADACTYIVSFLIGLLFNPLIISSPCVSPKKISKVCRKLKFRLRFYKSVFDLMLQVWIQLQKTFKVWVSIQMSFLYGLTTLREWSEKRHKLKIQHKVTNL